MTYALPCALKVLRDRLQFDITGLGCIGRFETYQINLVDWNLSLTDTNPCIWVQQRDLHALDAPQLAESLRDVVRERGWQNETVLVFTDGPVGSLKLHLPRALPTFILLDDKLQKEIEAAHSPTVCTLDIILQQMPRSQLAPYETTKPVVGGQFFGRRSEINKVLQHPNTNYLFTGIRRIGKTSLLKEIKRQMDRIDRPDTDQIRRLYVDCTVISTEDEFLRTLTYALDPSEVKLLMRRASESKRYERMMFDRFASLHGQPITFLIDELDRLLLQLGDNGRQLFDVLRAASNAGKARFIMAGFRQAMVASTDRQSPFYNFATPARLGRMKRADVRRMVLSPFDRLRISIVDREGVVNRINRETAGLPNYVQYYCKTLLEQLDEQGRETVDENDLRAVYENREFRDFVLDTFMSNTVTLERALVYALVAENNGSIHRRHFSQREMDEILKQRHLQLHYNELDRACRNLEVAGVFDQVGRDFEFAVPLFQRMLRETRDVEFVYEKTLEELQGATSSAHRRYK